MVKGIRFWTYKRFPLACTGATDTRFLTRFPPVGPCTILLRSFLALTVVISMTTHAGLPSALAAPSDGDRPEHVTEQVRQDQHSMKHEGRGILRSRSLVQLIDAAHGLASAHGLNPALSAGQAHVAQGRPLSLGESLRALIAKVSWAKRVLPAPVSRYSRSLSFVQSTISSAAQSMRRFSSGEIPTPPEVHEIPTSTDETAIEVASELADSIDELLRAPDLRDANIHDGGRSTECDVLDRMPEVCIGGTGPNIYRRDADLLVDLGGDDTYQNSAGGSDPNGPAKREVAIVVDVAGDDEYIADLPLRNDLWVAQGAAMNGGIGFLVDASGDDLYRVGVKPHVPPKSLGAVAQGSVFGSGVGLLADLQGADEYVVSSTSVFTTGLGSAFLEGYGIKVDMGQGNDSYTIKHHPSPSVAAFALGFGGSTFAGIGIFVDDGGTDQLKLSAKNESRSGGKSGATAVGFGGSLGGTAAAVFGPGNTDRSITATLGIHDHNDPYATATVVAYGAAFGAFGAGAGFLLDTAGNDSYIASSETSYGDFGSALTIAMAGSFMGSSALHDELGNDNYVARAHAGARSPTSALVVAQASVIQRGVAQLVDGGGQDSYQSISRAGSLQVPQERDGTYDGAAISLSQAFAQLGRAQLVDEGGLDSYESSNQYWVSTRSAPLFSHSYVQASVGGYGVASLVDIGDGGIGDIFGAHPKNPACEGRRGGTSWKDCGAVDGSGRNDS